MQKEKCKQAGSKEEKGKKSEDEDEDLEEILKLRCLKCTNYGHFASDCPTRRYVPRISSKYKAMKISWYMPDEKFSDDDNTSIKSG